MAEMSNLAAPDPLGSQSRCSSRTIQNWLRRVFLGFVLWDFMRISMQICVLWILGFDTTKLCSFGSILGKCLLRWISLHALFKLGVPAAVARCQCTPTFWLCKKDEVSPPQGTSDFILLPTLSNFPSPSMPQVKNDINPLAQVCILENVMGFRPVAEAAACFLAKNLPGYLFWILLLKLGLVNLFPFWDC